MQAHSVPGLCLDLHGDEGSFKHFIAQDERSGAIEKKLYRLLKNINFQKNNSSDHYLKTFRGQLGLTTPGLTNIYPVCIEGSMKHPLGKWKTLQEEPMRVGERLVEAMLEL